MNINQKHKLTLVISIATVISLVLTIIFINHDKLFKPLVDKTVIIKKEEIIPAKQVTVLERKFVPDERMRAESLTRPKSLTNRNRFKNRKLDTYSYAVRPDYHSDSIEEEKMEEHAVPSYKEELVEKKVVIPAKKVTKQVKTTVKVTKEGLSFEVGNVVLDIALAAISTVLIYFLKKKIDWYFEKKKILLEHEIAATT